MSNSSIDYSNKYNENNNLNSIEGLSQYLKAHAGTREGRPIPPLDKWHPSSVGEIDMVIKANGEWWHEDSKVTRQSLVSLFATVLWKEQAEDGSQQYYLKTPVQKLKITVEDAPLLINDVGIVNEEGESWLEFTTFTGDVVRLDPEHQIELRAYQPNGLLDDKQSDDKTLDTAQVRPYMPVRNGLEALIGRNTFYHLTELGELSEKEGQTILTLQSGGQDYTLSMPSE
ncbi:DUF1285 domain-containing protein [Psychrobacter pygoscelis]|uniref:DUF1285 domain-containing protein n=1 Tax=Psychrobacter pygoscelis TaxID=2488563 RepID=UPI00103A2CC8|nr:DUF1285 domain-containing protein [Psychrobacter pygoscelis]